MLTVNSDYIYKQISQYVNNGVVRNHATITYLQFILRIVLPNITNIHLSHSRSVGDKSESAVRTSWPIRGESVSTGLGQFTVHS